jgi:hypothetical protein
MIGSDDFPQLDSSDGAIVQHPGVSILAFRGMGKDNNYRRRDPVKFKRMDVSIITLRYMVSCDDWQQQYGFRPVLMQTVVHEAGVAVSVDPKCP